LITPSRAFSIKMRDIQDSGGKEGENEHFAVPQHIRMSGSRIRFPKCSKGIRFKGSEEKPSEIKSINQIIITKNGCGGLLLFHP